MRANVGRGLAPGPRSGWQITTVPPYAGATARARFAEAPTQLYTGRLLTGVGGTLFNLVLTKMVSEWFFGKEIITALSIMLGAWPIGIAIGLLTTFTPDALVAKGWAAADARSTASLMMRATLVSLPLGGRLVEKSGYVTPGIAGFRLLAACSAWAIFIGRAPAAMLLLFGLAAGVPGGALLALTSQATTPANRGPGLGVFYTWYYAGMTIAPAVAGWLRDTLQQAGAPVLFAGALMVATVFIVLLLRLLQARWPIPVTSPQ